jgi:hypothetical protein
MEITKWDLEIIQYCRNYLVTSTFQFIKKIQLTDRAKAAGSLSYVTVELNNVAV